MGRMIAEYWPAIVFLGTIAAIVAIILVAIWLYDRA